MNTYGGRHDSSVEVGHVYAPDLAAPWTGEWEEEHGMDLPVFDGPSMAQIRCYQIARRYSARPILLSLVDDISSPDSNATLMTELSVIDTAWSDDTYRESEWMNAGLDLVERLRTSRLPDDYRLNPDGTRLVVGSGRNRLRIPLVGFRGQADLEHPSCIALDAAWATDRLISIAPDGANILPTAFKPQQEQVAAIARILPELRTCRFTSIFVGDDGNPESKTHWQLGA